MDDNLTNLNHNVEGLQCYYHIVILYLENFDKLVMTNIESSCVPIKVRRTTDNAR